MYRSYYAEIKATDGKSRHLSFNFYIWPNQKISGVGNLWGQKMGIITIKFHLGFHLKGKNSITIFKNFIDTSALRNVWPKAKGVQWHIISVSLIFFWLFLILLDYNCTWVQIVLKNGQLLFFKNFLDATDHVECSARDGENVREVFAKATKVTLMAKKTKKRKIKNCHLI